MKPKEEHMGTQTCDAATLVGGVLGGGSEQGPQAVAVAVCSALVRLPDIAASEMFVEKVSGRVCRAPTALWGLLPHAPRCAL